VLGPANFYNDEQLYTIEQTGSITINGTLSGVLISRTRCGVVIHVSELDGAAVSGGFGSVYFSRSGPAEHGDILVADLDSATGTIRTVPLLKTYAGSFHVKGD